MVFSKLFFLYLIGDLRSITFILIGYFMTSLSPKYSHTISKFDFYRISVATLKFDNSISYTI
ncbi:hypothetical protein C488_12708 [Natrinema pellirubrum DSM 15624]|uniref:Uncharacterized protein n=1 Tax=Natrinema pellirubrum (strain DSM 15624 / CIP 106293 / JCM 10476 / NCIMB 786 / 157) TaxID=797303 RepID=L9YHT3_NATP1|nr:hypothetical protein C488_12708 [Natrinema pellirubrum DSM 15624]